MERSRALHIPADLTTRVKNHEVTYVFYLRSVTLLLPKPKPVRPDQAILIEVFSFSLAQKILSSSSRVLFLSLVKTSFSIPFSFPSWLPIACVTQSLVTYYNTLTSDIPSSGFPVSSISSSYFAPEFCLLQSLYPSKIIRKAIRVRKPSDASR